MDKIPDLIPMSQYSTAERYMLATHLQQSRCQVRVLEDKVHTLEQTVQMLLSREHQRSDANQVILTKQWSEFKANPENAQAAEHIGHIIGMLHLDTPATTPRARAVLSKSRISMAASLCKIYSAGTQSKDAMLSVCQKWISLANASGVVKYKLV